MRLDELAQRAGLTPMHAANLAQAVDCVRHDGPFSVILLTTTLGLDGSGDGMADGFLQDLRTLVRHAGRSEIVLLTEHNLDIATCCDLVQLGVGTFVDHRGGSANTELVERLRHALHRYNQTDAGTRLLHRAGPGDANGLVWESPAMADLLSRAVRAAQVSDVPILIYGESGTGKQLLAELIHQMDPKRGTRRCLSVNCSAITGTLAESMLFGHVKGAFTGASSSRKGIFRAAEGGTVVLDEIGEMDLALQPKLLRVLQESAVMPVGADEEEPVDVRVIAATNRRLAALVEQGRFRLDLYQRLNVITLEIPPLRERPEDIPALVRFFLRKYASYYERPITDVDSRVYEFLTRCSLEGNVRELENTIRQMLAFKTAGDELTLSDIPPAIMSESRPAAEDRGQAVLTELAAAACRLVDRGEMTLPEIVSTCEKLVLQDTLKHSNATSADLARRLGLSRRTLYNKIRKYDLFETDRRL